MIVKFEIASSRAPDGYVSSGTEVSLCYRSFFAEQIW